ncbi:MAG: transglutaminase, partial [Flavobacteriaceae bacterium]|nr:transglutaminase [Flavobacteriaceae bacterium]
MSKIDEVGNITGKTREQKFRYNAYLYRENNNDLSIEQYQEKLEKKRKGIEIDELSITNKNDIDQPIVETYSFASNRFVDIIGDRMYFSPMLFFEQLENPFKLDKRIYPIEFDFPFKDNYNITITIPDGYIIETLPENLNLVINKEYGAFKFIISNVSNTIQLLCSLEMKTAIIPNQDYETLKLFFKEIVNKQSEKVVLKKI